MKKADALAHWQGMEPNADPLPHFRPIPYKTEGSRYGCAGVRIDGPPAFVDAVLSCLKSLIPAENHVTRLELARHSVEPRPGFNAGRNADTGAEVCYVRCHVRGPQGAAASAFFDRHLKDATRQFAAAHGIDA